MTNTLSLNNVSKAFEAPQGRLHLYESFSMEIRAKTCVAILGRSGLGKTTLLHLISGLERHDSGTMHIPPQLEPIYLVPQLPDLIPWRTVHNNILLGCQLAGRAPNHIHSDRVITLLGLRPLLSLYPHQISGGMIRKTLLARALVTTPSTVLLDEPFASLDFPQRVQLIDGLQALVVGEGYTVMLVTHDVDEAVALADRLVVLAGRPASVVLDIPNPIDSMVRSRGLQMLRTLPAFTRLANDIWKAIQAA